jgi:hypothetical protein
MVANIVLFAAGRWVDTTYKGKVYLDKDTKVGRSQHCS